MFVCVFAKKFPALASQSCCEVSRPRAVGEYEYRLLLKCRLQDVVSNCSSYRDKVVYKSITRKTITWLKTNTLLEVARTFL